MNRKNYTGIAVIVVIATFDVVVYQYQSTSSSDTIPVCYPAGKLYDVTDGEIESDSAKSDISIYQTNRE